MMKRTSVLALLALLPALAFSREKAETPFETPERVVAHSPAGPAALALAAGESVVDYEVSPGGGLVALDVKSASGYEVRFWRMGDAGAPVVWKAPAGTTLKGLTWHPVKERTLFLLAASGKEQTILRLEERGSVYATGVVLKTRTALRRIVAGPRPSQYWPATGDSVTEHRLFYGAALRSGSWSVRSVTESGVRDVQIVGPKATMDKVPGEDESPSVVTAPSALPLGFHPAGDRLLWEEPGKGLREARFGGAWYEEETPFFGSRLAGGTATWLANGLGLVHWRSGVPGATLVLAAYAESRKVAGDLTFVTTPANVPDGRGLVGLTKEADGRQTLRFVPVAIPLGDVANAWMFVEEKDDTERFTRHGGLFRPSDAEQLHSLYDSELYGGGFGNRPFVVTTDVFWESFAAAFQGLFVLRERVQAIPAFWEFVKGARTVLAGPGGSKLWGPAFTAAAALETAAPGTAGPGTDPEVARILAMKPADSPIVGPRFDYGELKPRGNYAATPRTRSYFMAFRYLTEVARREVERRPPAERRNALDELAKLPPAVKSKGRAWIGAYEPFIAPGRAPVVLEDGPFDPPPYASHPSEGPGLFPLSFGFDNEVFLTTVFHETWPADQQIQDKRNRRLLPSGLDLAAVSGSGFARELLADELRRFPNLGGALDRLGEKWRRNRPAFAKSPSLYHRWLDALAVQWADEAVGRAVDGKELWRAKRLQTGLASFATLRHTTVLVNEREAAEAGEGGWEAIVPKPPRGWVEADPAAFEAIASLFDVTAALVKDERIRLEGSLPGPGGSDGTKAEPLRQGVLKRLLDVASKARLFAGMARKELSGQALTPQEYDEIYHVGRLAEHSFLVFKSLANEALGISNPDPLPKVVDVAGGSQGTGFLLMGVGKPLVWDLLVPYFGRREAVRGSVYSFYEVVSTALSDDEEWRRDLGRQKRPGWVAPFVGNGPKSREE